MALEILRQFRQVKEITAVLDLVLVEMAVAAVAVAHQQQEARPRQAHLLLVMVALELHLQFLVAALLTLEAAAARAGHLQAVELAVLAAAARVVIHRQKPELLLLQIQVAAGAVLDRRGEPRQRQVPAAPAS